MKAKALINLIKTKRHKNPYFNMTIGDLEHCLPVCHSCGAYIIKQIGDEIKNFDVTENDDDIIIE